MSQKKTVKTNQKSKKTTSSAQKKRSSSHTKNQSAKAGGTASKTRRKKQSAKPRLRMGRLIALLLVIVLLIGGGGYAIVHFNVFSRVSSMLSDDETAQGAAVSHDREIAQIKQKNALDTVDGVSAFSDEELRECFYSTEISDKIRERMVNMGYTDQVPLEDLRYVRVLFYDFEGRTEVGELIVNKDIAQKVENVFYDLYMHRYPIQKMILPDAYGTRIAESFADNNTVALCFGLSEDSSGQEHETGYAIDINPLYNPLIRDNGKSLSVFPMEGQLYLDRTIQAEHYIYDKDYAVTAFEKEGFVWKGDQKGNNDYKHFEYPTSSSHSTSSSSSQSSSSAAVDDGAVPDVQQETIVTDQTVTVPSVPEVSEEPAVEVPEDQLPALEDPAPDPGGVTVPEEGDGGIPIEDTPAQ